MPEGVPAGKSGASSEGIHPPFPKMLSVYRDKLAVFPDKLTVFPDKLAVYAGKLAVYAGTNPQFDPSNSHFDPSKSQFDPSKCDFDGSNSCTRQEEAGRDSRKTHLEPYEKRTVACRKGKRTVRNENHNALLNQFKTKP